MHKFKHKNTDIWIWKFCLLKIYLDNRELMNTSWLTAKRWLRLMNTTDWRRKITRDIFLNSQFLTISSSLVSFALCPMKKVEALFIGNEVRLESILNLESWKFWNPSRVKTTVAIKSAEREYFFFFLSHKLYMWHNQFVMQINIKKNYFLVL